MRSSQHLEDWRQGLAASLTDSEVTLDTPLAPFTTLRIGGPADLLVQVESEADLLRVLTHVRKSGTPLTVLGKGSNVLVSDAGLRGVVLRLGRAFGGFRAAEVAAAGAPPEDPNVWAGAGLANATFVERARAKGLGGMEFLVTIPGCIGGAVAMNAGAFKGDVGSHLAAVRFINLGREPFESEVQPASMFSFAYRASSLRAQAGRIVLEAQFRMTPTPDAEIQARKDSHMVYRRDTQPREYPNCGSVFKNPPGGFAAKLTEEAGLKGHRHGGAQISEKHANFIVNRGGATAADVLALIDLIQRTVYDRTQIRLEPEVQLLGMS